MGELNLLHEDHCTHDGGQDGAMCEGCKADAFATLRLEAEQSAAKVTELEAEAERLNDGLSQRDKIMAQGDADYDLLKADVERLRGALEHSRVAMNDLLHLDMPNSFNAGDVRESRDRIGKHGGMVTYVADVLEIMLNALNAEPQS